MSQYPVGKEPPCPEQRIGCTGKIRERGARMCSPCDRARRAVSARETLPLADTSLKHDRQKAATTSELKILKSKYAEALRQIEQQTRMLDMVGAIDSTVNTATILPLKSSKTSEATPVIVASDWHIEERVGGEVGALNRFDLSIARERAQRFWQSALRLVTILQQDVQIKQAVLALLGDFITGNIHGEENAELNELQPIHAIIEAQNLLASGIEFLLAQTSCQFTVVCHSGNHARTTKTTRFSAENGHSLEFLMYKHLAAYFRHEKRLTFIVPESPHSYVTVYDKVIRFQHGHMIKYGGGVGGIYIPTAKKIAKWNQARRADLDVFGHFHQQVDGGNFMCNGSLIGFNGFALSIGASFEPPRQTLFLLDKKRGRTITAPIILSD